MAATSPDSPAPNVAWEQRYGADGYHYATEPNEFLREHVGSLPRGRVLCLAEGEGRIEYAHISALDVFAWLRDGFLPPWLAERLLRE